ncbi:MAG: glutamate--tRNA ligase family protein [Aureliella sp.]
MDWGQVQRRAQGALFAGRLAPSPTGALHLGNARSFLLAWLSMRSQGGRVYLRIEDTDSPRVKDWAYQQTIDDLQWLGLDWDRWSASEDNESGESPLRQTLRVQRYLDVFQRLVQADLVYVCQCTRKDVAEAASAPHDAGWPSLEGDVYPGTCRDRLLEPDSLNGPYCWRMKLADEVTEWMDLFAGRQSANPAKQLGDFVIAKSVVGNDGQRVFVPSYQLAVVIDDLDQGVSEVVRGDDLIFSTYRQLAIWRFLGQREPKYFHVPLMIGKDGRRLAKRHGDTRIATLRALGITPESVVGYLLNTCGLLPRRRAITPSACVSSFDWSKVSKEPTVFDLEEVLPSLRQLSLNS